MTENRIPSPDQAVFLTRFSKLKQQCNDDPKRLKNLALEDPHISECCYHLHETAESIVQGDGKSKKTMISVDQDFRDAWRDYQERYRLEVFYSAPIFRTPVHLTLSSETSENMGSDWKERWNLSQIGALRFSLCECFIRMSLVYLKNTGEIKRVYNYIKKLHAAHRRGCIKSEDIPEDIPNVDEMLSSMDFLQEATGINPNEVVRRHSLLSTVHITQKAGATHPMLEHLEQAQRAFVGGAPLASVALIRSIMEVVLRQHYRTEDDIHATDLEALINNASDLPPEVNPTRLHDIRRNANAILHADPNQNHRAKILYDGSDERLETEIASMFKALRELIEGIK